MNRSIFSKIFLEQYLKDFKLAAQTDIFRKKDIIDNWIKTLESNRLDSSKEEETKSRFILEIFGDVLGFNYKNPSNWLVREELKTNIDATKPDAALGSFKINETGIKNDVHVVIEIKNSKSLIDKPQNRTAFKISPVDQAFLYSSKVGGNCKWVVVSNFIEIRFYHQSSQGEYQSYKLSDLRNEDVLREFLFLFHKDRLTNSVKSATDKLYELREKAMESVQHDKHIIDLIYEAIYKFEGLDFVDPNFLCNVFPFNTSEDYVWHYNKGRLLTLNPDISDFLKEVITSAEGISLSKELLAIIKKKKVVEAAQKVKYIFERLNQFRVEKICSPLDLKSLKKKELRSFGYSLRHFEHINENELVILSTGFGPELKCDCISCSFRNLDFDKYINNLKKDEQNQKADTLDLAYGHYLISSDNFKKSYFLYKNVDINTKGREDKKIHYFLSKINQLYLFNLVASGSKEVEEKEILRDIKSIDLDRSIHDELELYVDPDVRKYLIEIKDNKLFRKTKDYINESLEKSNLTYYEIEEIHRRYLILHKHVHNNKIIYDAFSDYQKLSEKVFRSMISAYTARKPLITDIPGFYFMEAILYIPTRELESILKPIIKLCLSEETNISLIEKAKNLLASYARETSWGNNIKEPLVVAQLENFWFQSRFLRILSNLFVILSKTELPQASVQLLVKPIFTFIMAEDFLGWNNLNKLGVFIQKYGVIFTPEQLQDMLSHSIGCTKYGYHKYDQIIKSICHAYRDIYSSVPIKDKSLVPKAIANSMDTEGRSDPRPFIYLYPIIGGNCKKKLLNEIDGYLNRYFDEFTFFDMLELEIISLYDSRYLEMYIDSAAKSVGFGFIGMVDGVPEYNNLTLINFITKIYEYNIQLSEEQLIRFTNLGPFESWALNPHMFNYEIFETDWLIVVNLDFILKKLAVIPAIHTALEKRLSNDFNFTLAEIYFKYFANK